MNIKPHTEQVPTPADRESQDRFMAGWHCKETGEFNFNHFEKGTLERSAYMAEAHKIAHDNGELL